MRCGFDNQYLKDFFESGVASIRQLLTGSGGRHEVVFSRYQIQHIVRNSEFKGALRAAVARIPVGNGVPRGGGTLWRNILHRWVSTFVPQSGYQRWAVEVAKVLLQVDRKTFREIQLGILQDRLPNGVESKLVNIVGDILSKELMSMGICFMMADPPRSRCVRNEMRRIAKEWCRGASGCNATCGKRAPDEEDVYVVLSMRLADVNMFFPRPDAKKCEECAACLREYFWSE